MITSRNPLLPMMLFDDVYICSFSLKVFLCCHFFYLDMFDRGGAGMTCWSCSHHWVASKCTASSHHGFRRLCILHLGRGREVFRCVFWRQVHVFTLFYTTMYVFILLRARGVLQQSNLWKRLTVLSWQSEAYLWCLEILRACSFNSLHSSFSILYNMQILSRGFRASQAIPWLSPQY